MLSPHGGSENEHRYDTPSNLQSMKSHVLMMKDFIHMVLEKDDMLLCVACLRIHGQKLQVCPLIATSSKYHRQGSCKFTWYFL
ncbi:increased DNA methylation 1-like isoform X2 [Rutidosis leptorrhynchoides]|uniref:increased DNA methylation 1-like isoform X2 n=1 Tax=Rutidosis leptorrhynchoides TaxID=125765 RepID=UPI003A9A2C62